MKDAAINLMPVSGYQQVNQARAKAIADLERYPNSRMKLGAVRALTHLMLAIETGRA